MAQVRKEWATDQEKQTAVLAEKETECANARLVMEQQASLRAALKDANDKVARVEKACKQQIQ